MEPRFAAGARRITAGLRTTLHAEAGISIRGPVCTRRWESGSRCAGGGGSPPKRSGGVGGVRGHDWRIAAAGEVGTRIGARLELSSFGFYGAMTPIFWAKLGRMWINSGPSSANIGQGWPTLGQILVQFCPQLAYLVPILGEAGRFHGRFGRTRANFYSIRGRISWPTSARHRPKLVQLWPLSRHVDRCGSHLSKIGADLARSRPVPVPLRPTWTLIRRSLGDIGRTCPDLGNTRRVFQ